MQIIAKRMPWIPGDLINPLLYLVGCALLVKGLMITPSFHWYLQGLWWWLPWNMVLAWLPLFFSLGVLWAAHGKLRLRRLLALPFGIMWLIFYPNAPYMLTTLIHLNQFEFYTLSPLSGDCLFPTLQFSGDPAVWFNFLLLVAGVAVGSWFGSLSLVMLQRYAMQKLGAIWGWLLVVVISLLSGVAIWIGRVVRFNSWDMLLRPLFLFDSIATRFDRSAFLLCILFAVMSAAVYLLSRMFLTKELTA